MSEYTTTIQRLDIVIRYLAGSSDAKTHEQIYEALKQYAHEMSSNELERHLNQLVADGYVKLENKLYSIVTRGTKLSFDGGYEKEYQELERMKQLQLRQTDLAEIQTKLAKDTLFSNQIVAGGAIVAALLSLWFLLWDIYKFHLEHPELYHLCH